MEINQIQYVLEIAKTSSISKAATNLYLSQSNLSYAIKSLESELGNDLFVRTNRGVSLSDFGQQFIIYAQPLYEQYCNFKLICHDVIPTVTQRLSISSTPLKFVYTIFIEIYNEYKNEKTNFAYKEANIEETLNSVNNAFCDIGVVQVATSWKKTFAKLVSMFDLNYEKLSIEKPYVYFRKDHPLANYDVLTLDDIIEYPFATNNSGSFNLVTSENMNNELFGKLLKDNRINVDNRACLYELIINSDVYSIGSLNDKAYENEIVNRDTVSVPLINTDISFEIALITKGNVFNEIQNEFIKRLTSLLLD